MMQEGLFKDGCNWGSNTEPAEVTCVACAGRGISKASHHSFFLPGDRCAVILDAGRRLHHHRHVPLMPTCPKFMWGLVSTAAALLRHAVSHNISNQSLCRCEHHARLVLYGSLSLLLMLLAMRSQMAGGAGTDADVNRKNELLEQRHAWVSSKRLHTW